VSARGADARREEDEMRSFALRRALPAVLVALLVACSGSGSSGDAAPPAMSVSVTSVAFEGIAGGADPAPRSFTVSNGGGGTLAPPTVSVSFGSGQDWLVGTVTGNAEPFTVTLQPVLGTLAAGTYAATVAVRSNGASNTPRFVPVTLSIAPAVQTPSILLSPPSVAFNAASRHGYPDPPSKEVSVTSEGGDPLERPVLGITYDATATGWLDATVSGAAPWTITLQPVTRDLGAGTYRAFVSVESPGASPASLAVTLTLTPTWTVFVYGHADNALSMSLVRDLQAMSAASLGDGVRVIVAADYSAGRRLPTGDSFQSGTEWFRIVGAGQPPECPWRPQEIPCFGEEQDFDDPLVLSQAVATALYAFPADRYAVVLWGRGGSWLGGFGGDEHDTPGGQGTPLSPADIAAALSAALTEIARIEPLDLVAFDAPSMLGQEVAFALRDVAASFVATGDLDGGGGWDYAATLGRLAANPAMSGAQLAVREVQDWDARRVTSGALDLVGRAHAAIDLSRMQTYADAWAALASAMAQSGNPDWLAVARRQFGTLPGYGAADPGDPHAQPVLRDAAQLLESLAFLSSDPSTAEAAIAAREALDGIVLATSLGTVRGERGQVGLHCEAALGTDWPSRADAYAGMGWDVQTRWSDVLSLVAGSSDVEPPQIDRVAQNTTDPTPLTPPLIQVRSTSPDVAAARLSVARVDGTVVTSYGAIAEVLAEPSTWYDLVWDLTLPYLSDGSAQSSVFLLPWMRGGSSGVSLVPGAIRDGAVSVEAYAVLIEGASQVEVFAVRGNGAFSVIPATDFEGLEFTPALFDEGGAGWVPGTPLTIPSAPEASLAFERAIVPPGTYRLITSMTDVWGNVGAAADDVTVVAPPGS
jgi:hypothetical protein